MDISRFRVVELGDSLAGSVAGYHLALAGADVVLIEPPTGCWLRAVPSSDSGVNVLWETYGRGKRSVVAEDDRRDRFLERADVIVCSAPDIDWTRARHQTVVALDVEGGTDLFHQAQTGFTAYLGEAARPPIRAGFEVSSFASGVAAAQAALAALLHRSRTGDGRAVSVSPQRVIANLIGNQIVSQCEPDEEISFAAYHRAAPQFGFGTATGRVEIIFFRDDGGWDEFCGDIGASSLAHDPRFSTYPQRSANKSVLETELGAALRDRSSEEIVDLVRRRGGFAVEKVTPRAAVANEQSRAIALASWADGVARLNSPWTIDGRRSAAAPAPALGVHGDEVEHAWFGSGEATS